MEKHKMSLRIWFLFVISVLLTEPNCFASNTIGENNIKKQVDVSMLVDFFNRLSVINSEQYLEQDSTASYNSVEVADGLKILNVEYSAEALAMEYECRMVALSEAGNVDNLLTNCLGALSTGIVSLRAMACEGIVQIMANRGDAMLLEAAIRRFEKVVTTEEAAEMRSRYDDILNPVSFVDQVIGTWVSPEYIATSYRGRNFPYYMLRIYSLDNDNGIQLLNIPGETTCLESTDILSLCRSQFIGGVDGRIMASFGSENLRIGNSEFAKSGFETTRNFRASSRATISTSKASLGDKAVATMSTELVAGVLDMLFSSTAQSYKHVAALNIDMTMVSPLTMSVNTQYYNYTVSTSNLNYKPIPQEQKNIMMVKWEPEDGVYFVDSRNQVFSITPRIQLDLSEYNAIMDRYSYKRSMYLVPTIAGIASGAAMIASGIVMLCDLDMKDKYGNQLYDSKGLKKLNNGKLAGGIILAMCGEVIAITVPIVISSNRTAKRAEALAQLNERQSSKLSRKGKMSISPAMNSVERGLSMCATLTF